MGGDSSRTGRYCSSGTLTAHSAVDTAGTAEWKGNARYEVVHCIGQGGMGVVYEAIDRERSQPVALKTLIHFSPAALYRFKQEFRTLADVQHPNLVRLHELVVTETDGVFFAMELVRGTDFLTYVTEPKEKDDNPLRSHVTRSLHRGEAPTMSRVDAFAGEPPRAEPSLRTSPANFDRLRAALRQLVEGIQALHGAGKLHRDIKPSNVLVAPDGRVVLLDFGVATQLSRVVDDNLSEEHEIVGTARYMAPEQAFDEVPMPASDWYSVGVMLYEALVGHAPFMGTLVDVLSMKALGQQPHPAECVEGVPPDLDSLCRALLDRDPEGRPAGAEILRRLGATRSIRPIPSLLPVADPTGATLLVGRETQLRALRDAFEAALSSRSITVRVAGASGMGKSAVTRHFLDALVEGGEAVVLRGRVYERESVPFKAIDSVIDSLSRYLVHLDDEGDPIELPADIAALARVFPVMRRVPSIGELPEQEVTDPQLVRRRAFRALRELLVSLAKRQPLVVYIDDVQWGDTDSAALLLELMRPPAAPPVLLVVTYRDADAKTSPFLVEMLGRWPAAAEVRDVAVESLELDDARRLALALLASSEPLAERTARAVAREARGSPFLIEELVRSNRGIVAQADGQTLAVLTLDQMISQRLERLPEHARLVLEIVAVGGRPLPVSLVAQASEVGDRVDEAIALAHARRFVHASLRDGREVVETSHDRFRETIVALLPSATVRAHHGRLARALESAAQPDVEALVVHLLGAGDSERAGSFALRAAEQAVQKVAFDRAETLFRMALETLPRASAEARAVRRRLAEVLEWAGRSADAGRVYLEAAEGAPAIERSELESAAAMQLLYSGRVDEGGRVLPRSLATVGVRAPRSALSALFWLIVYRLWLRVVGLRVVEREPEQVRGVDRARVEALYTAAFGMTFINVIVGACMQAKHLMMALRRGDRFQLLRAVTLEAAHYAPAGGPVGKREAALDQVAQGLADRCGGAEGRAFVRAVRGVRLFLHGRWKEAHELLEGAYENLPHLRAGWHSNANIYDVYSLANMGQFAKLSARLPGLLVEADQRGDLFTSVTFRAGAHVVLLLAADEPEKARGQIQDAMAQWSQTGFLLQHWRAMYWDVETDLYSGEAGRARERLVRDARALERSLLLKVQYVRGMTYFLRARCAVGSFGQPASTRAMLEEARAMIRRMDGERIEWVSALASMAGAAVANSERDLPETVARLREAIERAAAANMGAHASAVRHRLGAVLGGDGGRELVERAEEELKAQGVRAPLRFVSMLMPGNWP